MSATDTLAAQLMEIFGPRLKMVAAFGAEPHTCAIVDTVTVDDLRKCAALNGGWKRGKLDAPLLIVRDELARALDAFPLEFSEIIATRRLISGTDLLEGIRIPHDDLRRACEVQARSHLVHLREGYIEASGDQRAVGRLVTASAESFRALLLNVARLNGSTLDELMKTLGLSERAADFPEALGAAERLVEFVDRWNKR